MPVLDRQKQRREYLWKRAGADLKTKIVCLLCIPLIQLTIACGTASLCLLIFPLTLLPNLFPVGIFVGIGCALLTAILVPLCLKSFRFYTKVYREKETLRYVPPFTPSNLPAEEVLVRGALAPTPEQEALLRPAGENLGSPPEELLRSVNGPP